MFINQPDIILYKISSFLTVFEVQRLAWLSKLLNRKISENSTWKNLLMRESPKYEVVSPKYAKRLVLSLNGVTLPINMYKAKFFFQLENLGEVLASGGPCSLKEGTAFIWDKCMEPFRDYSPVPFKRAINVNGDHLINLKIYVRYEGMIAIIANSEIGNWDEDHYWSESGASAGEFEVDAWMVLEQGCEEEVKTDHYDDDGFYLVVNGAPWLEFHCGEEEEELKLIEFSSYLEQLIWKQYETDSSKEDCSS